jgi:dTDP-4-amino-4,6-dideoxy-D-galactose acyltransferase
MSLVERLQWDSSFFGLAIGRVRPHVAAEEIPSAVLEADRLGLKCIYLFVPADDDELIRSAEAHGFEVREVRVELGRSVAGHPASRAGLRRGRMADLPRLAPIARERFRMTRFFTDERFPSDRSPELYVEWLRRGLTTERERQTLLNDDGSGFVICHFDPDTGTGRIELIGVAKSATGHGLGRVLMAGAGALFIEASLTRATVLTQGSNTSARRLYEAVGYRTTETSLCLHRWWNGSKVDGHPYVPG